MGPWCWKNAHGILVTLAELNLNLDNDRGFGSSPVCLSICRKHDFWTARATFMFGKKLKSPVTRFFGHYPPPLFSLLLSTLSFLDHAILSAQKKIRLKFLFYSFFFNELGEARRDTMLPSILVFHPANNRLVHFLPAPSCGWSKTHSYNEASIQFCKMPKRGKVSECKKHLPVYILPASL